MLYRNVADSTQQKPGLNREKEPLVNRVAEVIQREKVISLKKLTRYVIGDPDVLTDLMSKIGHQHNIECLTPVPPTNPDPDLVYYRWKQNTDNECLWQTKLEQGAEKAQSGSNSTPYRKEA